MSELDPERLSGSCRALTNSPPSWALLIYAQHPREAHAPAVRVLLFLWSTQTHGLAWLSQMRRAMKRVMFAMLLCALGPAQASAQNEVSQLLLEWDEDQRNEAFTHMLWDSDRKCDHVIQTIFNGAFLGVDEWDVLCRDGRSYLVSVLGDLNDTIITSLSCSELAATSRRLLREAGSTGQVTVCKIRWGAAGGHRGHAADKPVMPQ